MTIVNTRSNQSSTRRFDNANSFFRVQRGLNSKSRWNKAEIFAAVVEPELLFYTSDVSCITDVIVSKFFALMPRLSKRQSLTTVLLRSPVTQMIFFNHGMLLLDSNHFLIQSFIVYHNTMFKLRGRSFSECLFLSIISFFTFCLFFLGLLTNLMITSFIVLTNFSLSFF